MTSQSLAARTDTGSAISNITQSLSIEIKRHKLATALIIIAIALVLGASGYGMYKFKASATRPTPFWDVKLDRITNSGNAIDAIISPDGKYIVYALSDRSSQSLWIRQVNTANDKQIVAPAPVGYFGITFSRDSTEVYYAVKANLDAGTLYRIPVLGGTPVKILEHIEGPVSLSPDSTQLVLIRGNYPSPSDSSLVIANVDGSNERVLNTRTLPERFSPIFFTGPSWSSDAKLIAATVSTRGGQSRVSLFNVSDGKETILSRETWPFAARVDWVPNMSGLLVIAGDGPGSANVWFLSYPEGKRRRITNDLSSYRALTVTADGSKFTTIQVNSLVNVWVVPEGDVDKASKLPTGNIGFYAAAGNNISWTPDGRIVYITTESGNPDIWVMDPDGNNRKQLTANRGVNASPIVTLDGRYIVYSCTINGARNIWRMDADGRNPIKLTDGLEDGYPTISPDGKWVIYSSLSGAKPSLLKVSIDGGNAVSFSNEPGVGPTISPDGKHVAYLYPESPDPFAPPNRIAIAKFDDGKVEKTFSIQSNGTVPALVHWSADGKSIVHSLNANNVSNIWQQSVEGGAPKQITNFKDNLITGYAWSNDRKQLVCTRGILLRDAVLVTDTK